MTASDVAVLPLSTGFGLSAEPFTDTSDESFFFPSDQHLRALEFMGHSLWTKARLGVVTADNGCGKSLLIKRLLQDLDERVNVATVQREHIGPREFLLEILRQFGFSLPDDDKTERRRLLERYLAHQANAGRLCLLIVENAQSMHPLVLEELRCLAAVEHEGMRVLKILLLGQPALNLVLESPRMAELVQGTVSRFSLNPFTEDQTAAYVAHRLRAAGAPNPDALMPYTLLPQIHACSLGIPANINKLCQRALVHAREEGAGQVTHSALDKAIEDLGWLRRRLRRESTVLEQVAALASSPSQAKLVVTVQGEPEREVSLNSDRVLVGRGEEADLRIDSVFISRYHALIVRDGNRDLLLDLGSTNGLLVNSRRIVRRALRHRDLIQVGPARVMYINEQANNAQLDPTETLCFARPGFPAAAGEEEASTLLAFGRGEPSA
ncbi:AAA family ATPase [Peristeroidobacter agariperforans]|uniref:AAA family ATPase n=1 Tax=Peristeroidobacter agariperforans TaxID=268404 RepID=UPI00101D6718|nr:AAA family ATPase [Peristeroidobacter agariperforans]